MQIWKTGGQTLITSWLCYAPSTRRERASSAQYIPAARDGIISHEGRKMWSLNDRSGSSHLWAWPQGSPLKTVRKWSKKKLPNCCFHSCVARDEAPFLSQLHSSLIITGLNWLELMSKVALSNFQQVRVSCAPFLHKLCFGLSPNHVQRNWRWIWFSY